MNLRLKKVKPDKRVTVTTRLTKKEYGNVLQKAAVHTDGNVSEWIRYAAQNCTPRRGDLEPEEK
jgi:hypothetical protein